MLLKKPILPTLALLGALGFSTGATAADHDDLYLILHAGLSVKPAKEGLLGGIVGYLPWDDLGFGLLVDQQFNLEQNPESRDVTRMAVELRWFPEPFEVSGDIGLMRSVNGGEESAEYSPNFALSAAYLWALTPSIAARFEVLGLFPSKAQGRVFGNLGARVLW